MEGYMIIGIVLFIAGLFFIAIEAMIPGFGVPGILGICCLVVGVVLSAKSVTEAVIIIAVLLVIISILLFVIIKLMSKGVIKTPLVLSEKQEKSEGYLSSGDLEYLIGKSGTTTTDLRPAGKAVIEGVEFDVISDGKFIGKGTKVSIYKISNSSPVVREADSNS